MNNLYEYEFTTLDEVKEFISFCPDTVQPILWMLYLNALHLATKENPHVH